MHTARDVVATRDSSGSARVRLIGRISGAGAIGVLRLLLDLESHDDRAAGIALPPRGIADVNEQLLTYGPALEHRLAGPAQITGYANLTLATMNPS